MNESKTNDKVARQIKITEIAFLVLGLLIVTSGVMFAVIHHRFDLFRGNLFTAAILVGIGSLAGCIYQTYVRLARIEEKLDKFAVSTEAKKTETAQPEN